MCACPKQAEAKKPPCKEAEENNKKKEEENSTHTHFLTYKSAPKCPECNSNRVWKNGLRYPPKNGKPIQRYICRECGYRFSESTRNNSSNASRHSKHDQKIDTLILKTPATYIISMRLGELGGVRGKTNKSGPANARSKLLCGQLIRTNRPSKPRNGLEDHHMKQQPQTEKRAAGATTTTQPKPTYAELKGKIIEMAWALKKEGYSEATIKSYTKNLERLVRRGANLLDPDNVKEVIASQETWSEGTKSLVVAAYAMFAGINNIKWQLPRYKQNRKLPFIPLESEIDALIAGCPRKLATLLQLLKETGMRPGEACALTWRDVDLERNIITVNDPEKGSNARVFKISNKLAAMLNTLPKNTQRVFGRLIEKRAGVMLWLARKRVAAKLQNPRLNYITLYTFRHWKATMEYAKTKDILHVMKMLGHRNINNTLLYTQLVNFESDEYHSAVAENIEEARKLIEAGFEYVCEHENKMLFRKRK